MQLAIALSKGGRIFKDVENTYAPDAWLRWRLDRKPLWWERAALAHSRAGTASDYVFIRSLLWFLSDRLPKDWQNPLHRICRAHSWRAAVKRISRPKRRDYGRWAAI